MAAVYERKHASVGVDEWTPYKILYAKLGGGPRLTTLCEFNDLA